MEVRFTVIDGPMAGDVVIDVADAAPVGLLCGTLGGTLGSGLSIDGVAVRGDIEVGRSGLRHGSRVGLSTPSPVGRVHAAPGVLEFRVIGGPAAGQIRYPSVGSLVVGRGSTCDWALPDPDLLDAHLELTVTADARTTLFVRDGADAAIDGHRAAEGEIEVRHGQVIQAGATFIQVVVSGAEPMRIVASQRGIDVVHRGPDNRPGFPSRELNVGKRPASPPKPVSGLVSLVGLAPMAAYAMNGNPWMLPLGLAAPVLYFVNNRRNQGLVKSDLSDEWHRYLRIREDRIRELESNATAELVWRRTRFPGPAELLAESFGPNRWVWSRRPDDAYFLELRIGLWMRPSSSSLREDRETGEQIYHVDLPAVPITVPLAEVGGLGIAGPRNRSRAALRSLLLQIGVLHSPMDVAVVFIGPDQPAEHWNWLRWLPHVNADSADVLSSSAPEGTSAKADAAGAGVFVAADMASARQIDRALGAILKERVASDGVRTPAIIVVAEDAAGLQASLPNLSRILEEGRQHGIYCLCTGETSSDLPARFPELSFSPSENPSLATYERRDHDPARVVVDAASPLIAETSARAISSLRAFVNSSQEGIPLTCSFFEMMGWSRTPEPEALRRQWMDHPVVSAVPIGKGQGGELQRFSLGDDVPHALAGGTTGSGKSEFLRTLVASYAVHNRPDRLNLLLVDFKGGAAFGPLSRLPHVVGVVDNLSPQLARRAIEALKAEAVRRQVEFQRVADLLSARRGRQASVDKIDEYWRACEELAIPSTIAKLIIVVDEFAELKRASVSGDDDFLGSLVSVAATGRSGGMHLVLATQDPSNAITDEIQKNTPMRVALRVVNTSASQDVIRAPDAGLLPRWATGRAYLRVGSEDLEPFQSAYISGPRRGERAGFTTPRVLAQPWPDLNKALPIVKEEYDSGDTELFAVVDLCTAAATGIERPSEIFAPPLPTAIALDEIWARPDAVSGWVLGLEDRPTEQKVQPFVLDIERVGHVMYGGGRQSGRTEFLVATALAARRAEAASGGVEVHLVGRPPEIGPLARLNGVGTVADLDDPLQLGLLIANIAALVRQRQRAPSPHDVRTVLLIDRIDTVYERDRGDPELREPLKVILQGGPQVGVHIIATGQSLPPEIESYGLIVVGPSEDPTAYGARRNEIPLGINPGTAFRLHGSSVQAEVRLGFVRDATAAGQFAPALDRLESQVTNVPGATWRIAPLPDYLTSAELARAVPPGETYWEALVGLSVTSGGRPLHTATPRWVPFHDGDASALAIIGAARTGKTNLLAVMGSSLLAAGHRVIVVSPKGNRSVLGELLGSHDGLTVLTASDLAASEPPEVLADDQPAVVLCDDADLISYGSVMDQLTTMAGSLLSGRALVAATADPPTFVSTILQSGRVVILDPPASSYSVSNAFPVPPSLAGRGRPGRATLHLEGLIDPIQVPHVVSAGVAP